MSTTYLAVGVGVLSVAALVVILIFRKKDTSSDPIPPEKKIEEVPEVHYPSGNLSIYFGSQTGTAEGFAKQIRDEAKQYGFGPKVVDLEDFEEDELKDAERAVFLMATYGEGEPTDNAVTFVQWMKGDSADGTGEGSVDGRDNDLEFLNYAVFGLGNRQYEQFNAMGKMVDSGLEKLGAKRMCELGMGDDDANLEDDFDNWRENVMWPTLLEKFGAKDSNGHLSSDPHQNGSAHASVDDGTSSLDGVVRDRTMSLDGVVPPLPELDFVVTITPPVKATATAKPVAIPEDRIQASTKFLFPGHHVELPVSCIRELQATGVAGRDGGSTLHVELDLDLEAGADTGADSGKAEKDKKKKKALALRYQTADNLGLIPLNSPVLVSRLIKTLGLDPRATVNLAPTSSSASKFKYPFPVPCTVEEMFTKYLDIQGPVKRSELRALASLCSDVGEQRHLLDLTGRDPSAKEAYHRAIEGGRVNLVDIVCSGLYPSLNDTLSKNVAYVVNACRCLQTRWYTISSSSSVYPSSIHLTVAVLKEEGVGLSLEDPVRKAFPHPLPAHLPSDGGASGGSKDKDKEKDKSLSTFEGLCTAELARYFQSHFTNNSTKNKANKTTPAPPALLTPAPLCRVHLRDSSFRLPADPSLPILLIGPGTGVAPMRAIIQERAHQQQSLGYKVGPTWLYFGCKWERVDYLYREEMEGYVSKGVLKEVVTAFSRDVDGGSGSSSSGGKRKKVYVQDRLRERGEEVWEIIKPPAEAAEAADSDSGSISGGIGGGGYVYVCGGTSMGNDVLGCMKAIVASVGNKTTERASAYVKEMQQKGRYVQELWA